MSDSNPDPVYPRAAAGTSPVVAGPTALHAKAMYTTGQLLEKPGKLPHFAIYCHAQTPSGRQAHLRISFRRHDIRSGPRFSASQKAAWKMPRKTPRQFPPMFTINPRGGSISEEILLSKRDRLALAIANGKSVAGWASQNDVPTSTAYKWANHPDVRRTIADCRRRCLDRALLFSPPCEGGVRQLVQGAISYKVSHALSLGGPLPIKGTRPTPRGAPLAPRSQPCDWWCRVPPVAPPSQGGVGPTSTQKWRLGTKMASWHQRNSNPP